MNKFYIGLIIAVLLIGITAGCQQSTENTQTSQDKSVPESKDMPKESLKTEQIKTEDGLAITVYKSPTCGCCSMWEDHLTKAGFKVTSKPTDNMTEIRKKYNVPDKMQSCHTGIIDGYIIEGHVPASDVKKLLKERPSDVVGLAAPGMPGKSPGMQPEGKEPKDYDVLSFDKQGNRKVFASY